MSMSAVADVVRLLMGDGNHRSSDGSGAAQARCRRAALLFVALALLCLPLATRVPAPLLLSVHMLLALHHAASLIAVVIARTLHARLHRTRRRRSSSSADNDCKTTSSVVVVLDDDDDDDCGKCANGSCHSDDADAYYVSDFVVQRVTVLVQFAAMVVVVFGALTTLMEAAHGATHVLPLTTTTTAAHHHHHHGHDGQAAVASPQIQQQLQQQQNAATMRDVLRRLQHETDMAGVAWLLAVALLHALVVCVYAVDVDAHDALVGSGWRCTPLASALVSPPSSSAHGDVHTSRQSSTRRGGGVNDNDVRGGVWSRSSAWRRRAARLLALPLVTLCYCVVHTTLVIMYSVNNDHSNIIVGGRHACASDDYASCSMSHSDVDDDNAHTSLSQSRSMTPAWLLYATDATLALAAVTHFALVAVARGRRMAAVLLNTSASLTATPHTRALLRRVELLDEVLHVQSSLVWSPSPTQTMALLRVRVRDSADAARVSATVRQLLAPIASLVYVECIRSDWHATATASSSSSSSTTMCACHHGDDVHGRGVGDKSSHTTTTTTHALPPPPPPPLLSHELMHYSYPQHSNSDNMFGDGTMTV